MFDKWIKIDDLNYKKLELEHLTKNRKYEEVNEILYNSIVSNKKNNDDKIKFENDAEIEANKQKALLPIYDQLTGILNKIKIEKILLKMDVTTSERYRYEYELLEFVVSYQSKYIYLTLIFGDRFYKVEIINISNIVLDIDDDLTFIDCKIISKTCNKNIMFLFAPSEIPLPIDKNIRYIYYREPWDYEKFKYIDTYKYNIGYTKYNYPDSINEGEYYTKSKHKIYLSFYKDKVILNDSNNCAHEIIYYEIKGEKMEIVDFVINHSLRNDGIGTLILNMVIDYAKCEGLKKIYGCLSNVDNDNKDRRNHVYKKAGFEVREKSIIMEIK